MKLLLLLVRSEPDGDLVGARHDGEDVVGIEKSMAKCFVCFPPSSLLSLFFRFSGAARSLWACCGKGKDSSHVELRTLDQEESEERTKRETRE